MMEKVTESGENIRADAVTTTGGKPVARPVPVAAGRRRQLGRDQGLFQVPEDFDAPLPDDVLKDFES